MAVVYISLIALVIMALMSWLFFWGDYCKDSGFLFLLGIISAVLSVIMAIIVVGNVYDWIGSKYKADILNREYGTKYTQEEIYFARNVIETIRQMDRQRIEVNGNILKGQ